ncbi:MAG: cysteine--tRNA ligase [Planctomycetaceae bacterium]|nr:cysteine--tRNA ligase [Planctomycetaceae bacterium]|tara:strand:- start:1235 stop:2770 length:1536 start_codon:yes stop_codon:yes gene_type:complete
MIRVYNTLSKQKEDFQPLEDGKVGIYLCGPTVYDKSHIGHMVGPIIFDTIKRYLKYSGYDVTWVVNITDVDDKLIIKSRERGLPMDAIAAEMTDDYLSNLKSLGVDQIDHMPRATENIEEIIQFTQDLIDKGFAYEADGDVFFDVDADQDYGKLSNRSADAAQGEGGQAVSRKKSASDFALWKSAKDDEPSWKSPWGKGRPGWHIECSAMSRRILGESFDIHGGGLDLVFPHHENELAQSECCHGKPMVKYWMHNGLMRAGDTSGKVGGRSDGEGDETEVQATVETKISRSKGAGGLSSLIERHGGERIRFFLLRTHYRSTIVFSEQGLQEAGTALEGFYRLFERYKRITDNCFYELTAAPLRQQDDEISSDCEFLQQVNDHRQSYLSHMDDDFNTGGATSDLFDLVRTINRFIDHNDLEQACADHHKDALTGSVQTLRNLTAILGIFSAAPVGAAGSNELTGQLMELMIALRAEARANKNFDIADRIRDGLEEIGITIEDRKDGTDWRVS